MVDIRIDNDMKFQWFQKRLKS